MTKQEFKRRWESGPDGDGLNYDDIADCAKEWRLCATPRIRPIYQIRYAVLKAAGVEDDEDRDRCFDFPFTADEEAFDEVVANTSDDLDQDDLWEAMLYGVEHGLV